jgi:hypothetical protein
MNFFYSRRDARNAAAWLLVNEEKGYSRIKSGPLRDWLLHRAVVADRFQNNIGFRRRCSRELPREWQVHHQAGKPNFAPEDLVALRERLHRPRDSLRCPYTGQFLKPSAWAQRMGLRL